MTDELLYANQWNSSAQYFYEKGYRFGGYEFVGADSDEKKKEAVLNDLKQFFLRLFSKYSAL